MSDVSRSEAAGAAAARSDSPDVDLDLDAGLRRLANAVLAQATADALGWARPNVPRGLPERYATPEEAAEARAWFRDAKEGFRTFCELAGYDPEVVRATLARRLQEAECPKS